jgi:hypothetical protein
MDAETLRVPSLWSIDRCTKHEDYVANCLRCQEEVLTCRTEKAYRAGYAAALAAPESDLASLKDLACQFHEWAKTSERVGGQEECAVALEKWIAEREPGGEPTR